MDIKIDINRVPRKKSLIEAMEKADVKNKWENSSWGKKLIVQKRRVELNDVDRFKLMLAKDQEGWTYSTGACKTQEGECSIEFLSCVPFSGFQFLQLQFDSINVLINMRKHQLGVFGQGVQGDLHDHESLVKAIKQVDVVISTVGSMQLADQTKLTTAIKEVGNVKVGATILI